MLEFVVFCLTKSYLLLPFKENLYCAHLSMLKNEKFYLSMFWNVILRFVLSECMKELLKLTS